MTILTYVQLFLAKVAPSFILFLCVTFLNEFLNLFITTRFLRNFGHLTFVINKPFTNDHFNWSTNFILFFGSAWNKFINIGAVILDVETVISVDVGVIFVFLAVSRRVDYFVAMFIFNFFKNVVMALWRDLVINEFNRDQSVLIYDNHIFNLYASVGDLCFRLLFQFICNILKVNLLCLLLLFFIYWSIYYRTFC